MLGVSRNRGNEHRPGRFPVSGSVTSGRPRFLASPFTVPNSDHSECDAGMRLRRDPPQREIHGKIVDWVNHSFEEGSLFVSIRFTDKTDFSLQFSPTILTDSIDLSDISTGNFKNDSGHAPPTLSKHPMPHCFRTSRTVPAL